MKVELLSRRFRFVKLAFASVFAFVSTAVCAENLYYTPASSLTATNKFGRYVYSSENWKTAAGEYKYPADGDVLVYRGGGQLTAQGVSGYRATHVSGFLYDGSTMAMSQGELQLASGGLGLVVTNTSNTVSWYLGARVYGSDEVPMYVDSGAAWAFQRYFWQSDGGAATLVKRGAGEVKFYDGSKSSSNIRATWKKTRLEAGTFMWCIYGIDGNKDHPDPQMFPVGHEFVFSDRGLGASFSIYDRDLELKDFTLREDSPLAAPNHIFTSRNTTNVNLRIIGTPGLNPMGFGGRLTGRVGLLWKPDSADNVFVFSNSVSTTKGDLIVSNGTMRLAKGATFTQLAKLVIGSGAKFEVETGAGASFLATELVLVDETAKMNVALAALTFEKATRNGVALADGVYTAANCDWVTGSGYVLVNASLPVQEAWWTNDADHPKTLGVNVQTNWYGLHLSGESLALTAGADSSVVIGAGGVDTAGAGSVYTIAWPLLLGASQVWSVGAGDMVSLTTDDLALQGGKTWCVNNADSGVLRLDGAKTLANNLVVSNGWLEVRGDESLGGTAGTTTFELYNSSGRKGKLRILPEEGKNEVSFHRSITFHYKKCGEWGQFMSLPANCTVNFYGKMATSAAGCEGNSWPCHWVYDCPDTTVVNWYGEMYAQLNHGFPGGTHHVWKALTGGDRFSVGTNTKVYLHVTGNKVGAATGSMYGKLYCLAPYALDGRSANQLITMSSTTSLIDMGGFDQALTVLHCHYSGYNGATITSTTPAFFHIVGNQALLSVTDPGINITNFVQFTGQAGLSMERTSNDRPLVLRNTSSSAGILQVTSSILKLAAPNAQGKWAGSWPNASAAVVKGGRLVLEHKAVFGKTTEMRVSGSGIVEIPAGVRVKVASLEIDGQPCPAGVYGSSESGAAVQDNTHFAGAGQLRVGEIGSVILLR